MGTDVLQGLIAEFLRGFLPGDLEALAPKVAVEGVGDVDLDQVTVLKNGTRVAGVGVVAARLQYGKGKGKIGQDRTERFPFQFDLRLDESLRIREIFKLKVNTRRFFQ